jgi:hypothetical protein
MWWHTATHGRGRRGNWRMEWVPSTLHSTSKHGVSNITTADAHTSAASSRLNWRPCRFKWTSPFRRKTKSGFCACAITFQTQSTVQKRRSNGHESRADGAIRACLVAERCVGMNTSDAPATAVFHTRIFSSTPLYRDDTNMSTDSNTASLQTMTVGS